MTCEGCSKAIKRVLSKIDGVTDIQADVESKLVTVSWRGFCIICVLCFCVRSHANQPLQRKIWSPPCRNGPPQVENPWHLFSFIAN